MNEGATVNLGQFQVFTKFVDKIASNMFLPLANTLKPTVPSSCKSLPHAFPTSLYFLSSPIPE